MASPGEASTEALHPSRGLEDLSAWKDDELCADMSRFMGEGGVFSKAKTNKYFDAVWLEARQRAARLRLRMW